MMTEFMYSVIFAVSCQTGKTDEIPYQHILP